jgi:Ca2+-binding RTX toxin-like protein
MPRPVHLLSLAAALAVGSATALPAAVASHHPGSCTNCADHGAWPTIDGMLKRAESGDVNWTGTERSDELLGHHGSDTLDGAAGSDILWGDWDPYGQPRRQHDRISGGDGNDFIYGSHGRNTIDGGAGNDAISIHYGRGVLDCGPGRDIYHVARSRRKGWKIKNCEKVDYRTEKARGGGLKPLK